MVQCGSIGPEGRRCQLPDGHATSHGGFGLKSWEARREQGRVPPRITVERPIDRPADVEAARLESGTRQMLDELTAYACFARERPGTSDERLVEMCRWLVGQSMAANLNNLRRAYEATRPPGQGS